MADNAKELLTPDQVWELEQDRMKLEREKLENELKLKQIETASAEKIAAQQNEAAVQANKIGFWTNVINAAKIAAYVIVAVVGFIFSWNWWLNQEAFEMQGHLTPESSKWSNKMFDWAVKRIDALKNM